MTSTLVNRKVNFNAGPALLPVEVVEEARENLLALGSSGVGAMEHSHRGKEFKAIFEEAEADCRELVGLSDDYSVLFLHGGASTQFFMVPMNFMAGGKTANYIETGSWSSKAIKEAKKFGNVHIAATSKPDNFTYIPEQCDCKADAVYTHFTSNNTIAGTQWKSEPKCDQLLVCDASSDALSKPLDISKYGLYYAGAQKNLGPAGVALCIIRKDWAEKGPEDLPTMLQYRTHVANGSMFNTPPAFAVYIMGLVFKWLKKKGGLTGIQQHNEKKAKVLYDCLDGSDYFTTPVKNDSRSLMNVVWRLPSEELEAKLIKEAGEAGFHGLKGHRSVGGLRASIYNAMSIEGVQGLVEFMKEFERTNG